MVGNIWVYVKALSVPDAFVLGELIVEGPFFSSRGKKVNKRDSRQLEPQLISELGALLSISVVDALAEA